jgi:hypothetical protein
MFKFQLFAAAGGVGLVLIASAFTAYDKSANYTQVTGEVFRVDRKCYLEGKERGVVTKTTTTTEEYPCPEMEDALANHPKYQGFPLASSRPLTMKRTRRTLIRPHLVIQNHSKVLSWAIRLKFWPTRLRLTTLERFNV